MSCDPNETLDPEDILWFSYDWCSLPWSPWVPFSADRHAFMEIPNEPGLYRIREVGTDYLMYIGETKRPLRQRLHNLRMELSQAEQMPWSDPHTEAPALWAYQSERSSDLEEEKNPTDSSISDKLSDRKDEEIPTDSSTSTGSSPNTEELPVPEPYKYECSAAPLDASTSGRRGMETFLLSRYRQEYGASPLCNFGRFHPRYRRSTNKKENKRGGKLGDDQKDNPAGFPSITPLEVNGAPRDPDWMGLEWTEFQPLSAESLQGVLTGAGLYLLADAGSHEIVYIGQSADLSTRLLDHASRIWDGRMLTFSYQIIGQSVLPHNLRELETDLIGNFFLQNKKAPVFQFRTSR